MHMQAVARAFRDELQKQGMLPLVPLLTGAAKLVGSSIATGAIMQGASRLGGSKTPPGVTKATPAPSANMSPNGGNYTY